MRQRALSVWSGLTTLLGLLALAHVAPEAAAFGGGAPPPTPPGVRGVGSSLAAASADPVFDGRLHDVRLDVAPGDWAALRRSFQENTYYRAAVTIDGERVPDIGIRSRGSGTRNGVKPGLKLDFNEYVSAQRYHGYKALVLENLYGDRSGLHELLSFATFEAMGIPAPACSFARVTVNGDYWGLYELVEDLEDRFVKDRYPPGKGTLYKYEIGVGPWDFSYRGPDPSAYIPGTFEPKTNETSYDPAPLVGFLRTVTEAPDDRFVEEVSRHLDVRAYLTYLAVEIALAEVDGQTGFFGPNNYYLYQLDGTTKFAFVPWDKDFCFTQVGQSVFHGRERNRLVNRLLADPGTRELYAEILEDVVRRFANERWLLPRAEAAYALIRDAMREDTKKPDGSQPDLGNAAFEEAVDQVRAVLRGRPASVFAQLPGPWILPSAASIAGAGGSRFTTDLVVANLAETAVVASVSYLANGGEGSALVRSLELAAGETRLLTDVVGTFFGAPDSYGSVRVAAGTAPLGVRGVTSTREGKGTYGQSVPAFGSDAVMGGGPDCVVAGVADGPRVRSNLILASASSAPSVVDVSLVGGDGRGLGSSRITLEAGRMTQLDRVARTLGAADSEEASLRLSIVGGSGPVAAYAARIDSGTNDPRTLLPVCAPSVSTLVPASARAPGANGAFFTTALVLSNPSASPATANVTFLGHDRDGSVGSPTMPVPLGPGETRRIEDVLGSLFGIDTDFGAIRVVSTGPPLAVGAETSTPAPAGGTHGQSVPGFAGERLVSQARTGTIAGFRDDSRFRTNLVLANAGDSPALVVVRLYAAAGAVLGETTVSLPPLGMTQLARVGRSLAGADVAGGRLVVTTESSPGVAAYASEIDDVSNDPRTLLSR